MQTKCIFYLLLVSFFYSCDTKHKNIVNSSESQNDILAINYKDSVSISLKNDTSPNSIATFPLVANDTSYLLLLNRVDNSIRWYDLETGDEVKKNTFTKEGPEKVGDLIGFYPISKDSILITPTTIGQLYLANSTGKVYSNLDYTKTSTGEYTAFGGSINFNPFVLDKGNLYLPQGIMREWTSMSIEDLTKAPLELSINVKSKKVEFLSFNYPKEIWKFGYVPLDFSRTWNGQKGIYSFLYDSKVYEFKNGSKQYTVHTNAKSIDDVATPSFKKDAVSFEDYCFKYGVYLGIVYDKYRKVYYRFYRPKLEPEKGVNVMSLIENPPIFSIIVMNDNFEKIGEVHLPKKKFSSSCFFISEKGLYLAKSMDNENRLTFIPLTLNK